MTIIKNGKRVNVNNGGGKAFQARMESNGWTLKLRDNCNETAQELYDRLEATGKYSDIKVYYTGTQIRGFHNYFAFVK